MARPLITERDILDAVRKGKPFITISENSIVTSAAKDAASRAGLQIETGNLHPQQESSRPKVSTQTAAHVITIAIGADHGGFQMKETLKSFIGDLGYSVVDVGTDSEKTCDYPDFAYSVAALVSNGKVDRGIMVDGVGIASSIVANKVPGIRSVPCFDEFVARSSREHNDANMLTLGGKTLGIEIAKSLVKIWLETPFGGGRHQPRIDKLRDIENRFLK